MGCDQVEGVLSYRIPFLFLFGEVFVSGVRRYGLLTTPVKHNLSGQDGRAVN